MKLIVGLGNPGKEYEFTRHNIGFLVLDNYLKNKNIILNKKKFNGLYTEEFIFSNKVIFLKPQSYINLSGEVIADFISYYKIDLSNILIIHDDMDLNIGTFKLKQKGSSAGHNGLKNIELHLKTQEYNRLKVGISKNKDIDTKDYVLGKITNQEQNELKKIFKTTDEIIEDFINNENMISLMSRFNKKNG